MMKLVFANSDYAKHTTNEGNELQLGLEAAGWTLAGFGYGDGCKDVPTLLDRHRPDVVFIQDPRDWHRESGGCFDERVSFERAEALAQRNDLFRVGVLKDAACCPEFQAKWTRRLGLDAMVIYYGERQVRACAPWLAPGMPLIRTYHSIDLGAAGALAATGERKGAVVSGATCNTVYPIRHMAACNSKALGLDHIKHPGYTNHGADTPSYLRAIARYKVHLATASAYGFALRKIIESVAVGCTPVTDLPADDPLPHIDSALVRIEPGIAQAELAAVIKREVEAWDHELRVHYASEALEYYDWHAVGERLDRAIEAAYLEHQGRR